MLNIQHQFVENILCNASHGAKEQGRAFASSNIALCKYWGKRDQELNLPMNGSLSISLGSKGTLTEVQRSSLDRFFLNDQLIDPSSTFSLRLSRFLDLFRNKCRAPGFKVLTYNTIPTAAGLASSASGYAALVLALDDLAGWQLNRKKLSMLARIGSGSAARSLYSGFVVWHAGINQDGLDSYAEQLDVKWPEFQIGILKLSNNKKPISSRSAMQRTVNTSKRYRKWPKRAADDLEKIKISILEGNFSRMGQIAEDNALEMHATMREAVPSIDYFISETWIQIKKIQKLRNNGLSIYLTIDAGPNIKLLFQRKDAHIVIKEFDSLEIIDPFGDNNA